ncbi:MAG TPA: hypothetical protein VFO70_03840 [Chitinophagaceae bacterium]|nr:hypothetical protein [Chitinophagaceae bacterium]
MPESYILKKTIPFPQANFCSHKIFFLLLSLISFYFVSAGGREADRFGDSVRRSTPQQAIDYIGKIRKLEKSIYWPNIDPELLLANLNYSIRGPLKSFEGKNTNFCAYTALSYIPLRHDPLGFAQFILQLYKEGKATMGGTIIKPGLRVRNKAGLLMYKGELDINHLGQMWFLSLADQFKGYLNLINQNFDEGDENTLWAATNFSKFNRMLRKLFGYKVKARGADLVRPRTPDIYTYLSRRVKQGTVFLYLNNRLLYKKNHEVSRFGIPTHYVVLTDIVMEGEYLKIIYWDAGRKTLQLVTPAFLNKIIFGITYCANP